MAAELPAVRKGQLSASSLSTAVLGWVFLWMQSEALSAFSCHLPEHHSFSSKKDLIDFSVSFQFILFLHVSGTDWVSRITLSLTVLKELFHTEVHDT